MHVISRKRIKEFQETCPGLGDNALDAWYMLMKKNDFESFAALKETFGSVDKVGRFCVFNIGGNKIRLAADIKFSYRKVFVAGIWPHREYDRIDLKNL